MWYVYVIGDTWEQGVTVANEEEARQLVTETKGQLVCEYRRTKV